MVRKRVEAASATKETGMETVVAKVKREHANNGHVDGDDGQESRGSSGADTKSVLRVIRQPPEIVSPFARSF